MGGFQKSAVLAALVGIAGCQTGEEYRAEINRNLDARLSTYHGASMASFIQRTGLTPVNAYPITGGRVFVPEGIPYS